MESKNYKEFYEKISAPFREHPAGIVWLIRANQIFTRVLYVLYPLFVCYLMWNRDGRWVKVTVVPGTLFVLLSAVRKKINRPRPYETWEICPLIQKDTKGKSMPSRHVFSAAVIAMAFFCIWRAAGIFFLIWSMVLAFIRVLGGVHYPSDVLTGLAIGILGGLLMLWL